LEASEATPAATEAAPEAPAEQQETPTPDLAESVAALTQRLDAAGFGPNGEEAEGEQQPVGDQDFIRALMDGGDYQQEYGDEETSDDSSGDEQPEAQEEVVDALDQYLRERDANVLGPALEQIEMRFRERDLKDLVNEYPDMRKPGVGEAIRAQLEHLAERYGEGVYSDRDLVEQTFLTLRGKGAAANETSAEEARGQGAAIETGAGAGIDSEDDIDTQITKRILEAGGAGSVFTP
jgi:hypothetical protein